MKQIIPFVKDLKFDTRVSEITSIALEHNLQMENNDSIVGVFTVSGKYKINDVSVNEEDFEREIPFDITLDDKYDALKVIIDIDDFYYEIINEESLRVHIDVVANNLVYYKPQEETRLEKEEPDEKESVEVLEEETEEQETQNLKQDVNQEDKHILVNEENKGERLMINEIEEPKIVPLNEEKDLYTHDANEENNRETIDEKIVNNLSNSFFNEKESYSTYKVHIIRENETLETIKETYNITSEELEKYNSIDKIMLGSKIIIPTANEE